MSIRYTPDGATITRFMQSGAFVRGLQGPIGSGKSVACAMECLRLTLSQERSIDPESGERTGPRKVRGGVIRNTTPQLETTTMKTWLEWMPEADFGPVRWRPPYRQDIRLPEFDLEAEVWFLALDREEDVRKLLSFEFTWLWLNEARELRRSVVTAAISRVNRYPRQIEGGATRACVIMDTNAPEEDHWWAIMSGQAEPPDWMDIEDRLTMVKPDSWEFFIQPPAVIDRLRPDGTLDGYDLNPLRENARYTAETYYRDLLNGQSRDWIQNMVQNRLGRIFAGRPVYKGFSETVHVAREPIVPVANHPIYVGVDFGLTPAAAFGQDIDGQVLVFDELVTRDMDATQFSKILKTHIASRYDGFRIVLVGDPRGEDRATTDSNTPFKIFRAAGLDVQPAWTNEPAIRIGAIETQLNTLVHGQPAYLLSPTCTYLLNGKRGGYAWAKDSERVDKNIYSHIADAEQYMILRMGYGRKLISPEQNRRLSVQAETRQAIFNRGGSRPLTARGRRLSTILSRG